MAHFIPYTKTVTKEETTKLLLDNIYRIHGLPNDIVLDKETQFTSNIWKGLFQLFGVKINFSTVYHPQTNRKTERLNQILEEYLRCIIYYQKDDWMDLLPLAEFAYNNTMHSSTKQTPFFSNYGLHPQANPFDVESLAIEDLAVHLTIQLYEAQDRYKDYAYRTWKIHPNFHVGDQVWLLQRNIQTK